MAISIPTIVGIGSAAGLLISAWVVYSTLRDANASNQQPTLENPKEPKEYKTMTFEELSRIWCDRDEQTWKFATVARTWCDPSEMKNVVQRVVAFKHPIITEFWKDKIKGKPFFTAMVETAVLDILELLDKYGDCPSVVDKNKDEPERMYQERDNNTYTELEKIPLYIHSLHCAEEAIKRTDGAHVTKLVIAMLAHDLGKIPGYYGRYYQSSTHPFCSGTVLESLESVTALQYWPDILAAVRNHHLQSDVPFDKTVRECDQAARRKEISALPLSATTVAPYTAPSGAKSAPKKSSAPKPLPGQLELLPATPASGQESLSEQEGDVVPVRAPYPVPAQKDNTESAGPPLPVAKNEESKKQAPPDVPSMPVSEMSTAHHNGQAIAGPAPPVETGPEDLPPLKAASLVGDDQQEKKRTKRQLVDISAWFEPGRFITELASIVNKRIDGKERYWSAIDKDGYVYFKPHCFWVMIERHSDKNSEILAAAAYEQHRDNIVYSAVYQLSKLNDVVATEFIGPDQMGSLFLHNPQEAAQEGKPAVKLYLIPLRSSAFAQYSETFASRLTPRILQTKELVPLYPVRNQ